MGIKVSEITDALLKLMNPSDRHPLGKAGITFDEAEAKRVRLAESREHAVVMNWSRKNNLFVIHARTSSRVHDLPAGWPDFTLIHGPKHLLVEMKIGSNKLSPEQQKVKTQIESEGGEVWIKHSADQTMRLMMGWLWENFRWTPEKP